MEHKITFSTNLLIVLAANRKRRSGTELKPRVPGIRVERKITDSRGTRTTSSRQTLNAQPLFY